jgi:hypothetical protein
MNDETSKAWSLKYFGVCVSFVKSVPCQLVLNSTLNSTH